MFGVAWPARSAAARTLLLNTGRVGLGPGRARQPARCDAPAAGPKAGPKAGPRAGPKTGPARVLLGRAQQAARSRRPALDAPRQVLSSNSRASIAFNCPARCDARLSPCGRFLLVHRPACNGEQMDDKSRYYIHGLSRNFFFLLYNRRKRVKVIRNEVIRNDCAE